MTPQDIIKQLQSESMVEAVAEAIKNINYPGDMPGWVIKMSITYSAITAQAALSAIVEKLMGDAAIRKDAGCLESKADDDSPASIGQRVMYEDGTPSREYEEQSKQPSVEELILTLPKEGTALTQKPLRLGDEPEYTWEWKVFGNDSLVAKFLKGQEQPSLRVRILSRIIMGSKWRKL